MGSSAETARLIASLELDSSKFNRGVTTAVRSVGSLSSRIGRGLGGAASHASGRLKELVTGPLGLVGGVGIAVAMEKAVSSARDFEAEMELIHTQAGASQAEVAKMGPALLAMARSVGTGPEALAQALYHVESAGLRGAKAENALRIAAEGARVGHADLESVTNALVGAINSGIRGTQNMGAAMGALNAIVGAGNMRMDDLAGAMSTGVLPAAKAFGLSLNDVGAALADMADQGVPAQEAATRLRMTFSLLGAPTSKAAKQLKRIGIEPSQLAKDLRKPEGLITALTDLQTHLKGLSKIQQIQLISRAFGGGRSSSAIITLLGSLDRLRAKQKQITQGAGAFGDAWARTQESAAFKWERFSATIEAVGIKLGNVVLPVITDALDQVGAWVDAHGDELARALQGAVNVGKQVGSVVMSAVQSIAAAWNAIPPEVRDLVIKGLVADRTISFLFGIDPAKATLHVVAEGLESAFGRALASSGVGKLFPQPVLVMNWPPGMLVPGAGPGLAPTVPEIVGGFLAPGLITLIAGLAVPVIMAGIIPILTRGGPGSRPENAPIGTGSTAIGSGGETMTGSDLFARQMRGLIPATDRLNQYLNDTGATARDTDKALGDLGATSRDMDKTLQHWPFSLSRAVSDIEAAGRRAAASGDEKLARTRRREADDLRRGRNIPAAFRSFMRNQAAAGHPVSFGHGLLVSLNITRMEARLAQLVRSGRGKTPEAAELRDKIKASNQHLFELEGLTKKGSDASKKGADQAPGLSKDQVSAIRTAGSTEGQAIGRTTGAVATAQGAITAAIAAAKPSIDTRVYVYVTAAGVQKAVTTSTRYGPNTGSAGGANSAPNTRSGSGPT